MNRIRLYVAMTCLTAFVTIAAYSSAQERKSAAPRYTYDPGPVRKPMDPANFDLGSTSRDETDVPRSDAMKENLLGVGIHPQHMRQKRVNRIVSNVVSEFIMEPISVEEVQQREEFQKAMRALRESNDDESRKSAALTIREYLVKKFDQDTTDREKELAPVEERVKSLRKQLDKRKSSKDEIISLRLKTIINNADGLGFPDDESAVAEESMPTQHPRGQGNEFELYENQRPGNVPVYNVPARHRRDINDQVPETRER